MKTKRFTKSHQFLDWYMRTPIEEQDNTNVIFDYHGNLLLPESKPYKLPEQPPNIYKVTAWGIGFAIFIGFSLGVMASTAVGVTVHFLTK